MEKARSSISVSADKRVVGGIDMLRLVAEISIAKLEDRKTVTAILHENGYTVGPGKRKKTKTGKTLDYYLKVYEDDEEEIGGG